MTGSQPCGACGQPVPPGPGRAPGQIWWHGTPECQAERRRHHSRNQRRATGARKRLTLTCRHCGGSYRPCITPGGVPLGLCSQPECARIAGKLRAVAQRRALHGLRREHPERFRELMREELERLAPPEATP